MSRSNIRQEIMQPPPEGYAILIDPNGMTQQGDLKWCPLHARWEPVNMDNKGVLVPGDFAPIHSYKYIARKRSKISLKQSHEDRLSKLVHNDETLTKRNRTRKTHYKINS